MVSKIVLISYRLGYGKLLYWDSILTAIKKKYKRFRVFTAFSRLETNDQTVETEKKLHGIKIYRNQGKINASLLYLPIPLFIIELFKYKPDIIILNEFNINSLYVIFFKRILNNPKILLLVESDPFLGYENRHSSFRTNLRKYIVRKSDKILTNNILGGNYLTNILEAKEEKIIVAPYLVSIPPSKTIKSEKSNKIKFLYVGRIIELKGLIYVLRAMSLLNEFEKNKIQFDIIGSGEEMLSLKKFVSTNDLFFVNFIGYVKYENLSQYYQDSDCFIFNSFGDYRALVGFEALNFGCAIIGSKFDGARNEVIHKNKNGFIVDPCNVDEIKSKISFLLNNENELNDYKIYSKKLSTKFSNKESEINLLNAIKSLNI